MSKRWVKKMSTSFVEVLMEAMLLHIIGSLFDWEKVTFDNYRYHWRFCLDKVICDECGDVRTSSNLIFHLKVVPTISFVGRTLVLLNIVDYSWWMSFPNDLSLFSYGTWINQDLIKISPRFLLVFWLGSFLVYRTYLREIFEI
jgi:hypothetical protein